MATTGVRQADLLGLMTGTLAKYPFSDVFQVFALSSYPMLDLAMRRKMSTDGGKTQNYFVNRDATGNFRWVRPYTKDATRINDTFIEGAVKMCFWDTHYAFDKKEEDLNKGAARLVNVVQQRRISEMKGMCDALERAIMGVPDDSSDDRKPTGFPGYFCLKSGTYTEGFVGETIRYGNHTTSSAVTGATIAGIDRSATANAKLKNWTGIYSNCDQAWLKKYRSAMMDVKITPPSLLSREAREAAFAAGNVVRTYFPKEQMLQVLEVLDSKNTNWGRNFNGQGGSTPMFDNIEFVHCPSLDPTDSSDTNFYRTVAKPIYTIDHGKAETLVLRDRWMSENPPRPDPDNHDGVQIFIDGSMQILVPNVRYGGFVFHKTFTDA